MAAYNMMGTVASEYLRETSFAHVTRMATEARTKGIAKWTTEDVDPRRKCKPPGEAKNAHGASP